MATSADDFYNLLLRRKAFIGNKADPAAKEREAVYHRQEFAQTHNAQRKLVWMPFNNKRDDNWQMDTTFYPFRGRMRAICCAIHLDTRMGFIRVYSSTSPTAKETVAMLDQLTATNPVKHLGVDRGSEYDNKAVKDWCAAKGVELYFYQVGQTTEKAIVERFNATVKRYINRVVDAVDADWLAYVPEIERAYNHAEHRTLGKAPEDMTAADIAAQRARTDARAEEYKEYLVKFVPGTRVRVWATADPTLTAREQAAQKRFGRIVGPRWSKELYTVEGVVGYKVKLKGVEERISPRDLQIITGDVETRAPVRAAPEKRAAKAALVQERALAEIDAAYNPDLETEEGVRTRAMGRAEETYIVERVVAHKGSGKGLRFEVKWEGYPASDNTWEPLESFLLGDRINLRLSEYLDAHPDLKAGLRERRLIDSG